MEMETFEERVNGIPKVQVVYIYPSSFQWMEKQNHCLNQKNKLWSNMYFPLFFVIVNITKPF